MRAVRRRQHVWSAIPTPTGHAGPPSPTLCAVFSCRPAPGQVRADHRTANCGRAQGRYLDARSTIGAPTTLLIACPGNSDSVVVGQSRRRHRHRPRFRSSVSAGGGASVRFRPLARRPARWGPTRMRLQRLRSSSLRLHRRRFQPGAATGCRSERAGWRQGAPDEHSGRADPPVRGPPLAGPLADRKA